VDPSPPQRDALAISRSNIPAAVFWDSIGSRARDLKVDESLLAMASDGYFKALAVTQDDAGSRFGLQVREEELLHARAATLQLGDRVLLNPGTDEMGMVMIVRAIEDATGYAPSVSLSYPSAAASAAEDRLEYLPIGQTIANLARFLKMADRADGDFELDTIAPDPDPAAEQAMYARIETRLRAGRPTAVADLTFLTDDIAAQRRAVEMLGTDGLASRPIAFASWNTTANTAGTALSAAAASLIGQRFGTRSADAAATFLFERYVDDYGYRLQVRPSLQALLESQGADTTALGDAASGAESSARALLWRGALAIFEQDFKPDGYAQRAIAIHLPWQRTFEVRIDADIGL
jgi:hypothetical protein